MLVDVLRQFCVKHGIGPCGIVAAVSGGTDSTALLLAFAELRADGFDVRCAHVNHRLRGADADADERFVRELCDRLGVSCTVADGSLDAGEGRRQGVEAAARLVRYARLEGIRSASGASFVATAHQRNDQAETVLMRLTAGGGISSLRGIHPIREGRVIRPLLDVTRPQIEKFLAARGVTAQVDRSNADPRFLRNRIRAAVRDLAAVEALAAIADQVQKAWPVLESAIDDAECAFVHACPDEAIFQGWPENPWLRQALLHRQIRRLDPGGAREVSAADLERLASALPGVRRVSVTRDLELLDRSGMTVLRRRRAGRPDFEVPLTPDAPVTVNGKVFRLLRLSEPPRPGRWSESGRQVVEVPSGEGAFTLRNRRRGDRFQPLGMPQPKKLKDFFIDRKIAAEERWSLPLLLWNGEIAWIAGVAVSERFKVAGRGGVLYEVRMEDAG